MVETINRLLDIQPGETVSALQKIKANPAKSSAPAMNALMHKMAAIEATGILGIDLSWLNANYQRAMFHYVRKCTADRLRELTGPRRLATLTCFLRQNYRDTIDQAVDMFDKIIIRMQADTPRGSSMNRCANSARPSRWHSLRCGLWERSFLTMTLTT
jgi:hypothetical protein